VVPPGSVDQAEVVERATFPGLVTDLALECQTGLQVLERSVVVPPGLVELAEVAQRGTFPGLVADLALECQTGFQVFKRPVVVPPAAVDLADVIECYPFMASGRSYGEGTLESY